MSVMKIHTYPDDILKKLALPVSDIDGDLQVLIDNMIDTMHAAPGVGLAAPQVGVSQRLIVVDISNADEDVPLIILVNPEIINASGTMDSEEGCLSIPGYTSTIRRNGNIQVKGYTRNGEPVEIEASGLLARVLQHEIDHLDGVLFIDRLSPIKKKFFKKRYSRELETI